MEQKKNMFIVKVTFSTPGGGTKVFDTIRANSTEEVLEKLEAMNVNNRKYYYNMELIKLEAINPWS